MGRAASGAQLAMPVPSCTISLCCHFCHIALHPVASHFYKSLKGFERSYDEHSKRRRHERRAKERAQADRQSASRQSVRNPGLICNAGKFLSFDPAMVCYITSMTQVPFCTKEALQVQVQSIQAGTISNTAFALLHAFADLHVKS